VPYQLVKARFMKGEAEEVMADGSNPSLSNL